MDIKLGDLAGTWKVLGTDGHTRISIAAPSSVKVEVGEGEFKQTLVIPIEIVVALQTAEAQTFIKSPLVAPFMWAANERKSRVQAAKGLANLELGRLRREYVALIGQLDPSMGVGEAWALARLKHPSESDMKLESERKHFAAKAIRKDPTLTHQEAEGLAWRKIKGPG